MGAEGRRGGRHADDHLPAPLPAAVPQAGQAPCDPRGEYADSCVKRGVWPRHSRLTQWLAACRWHRPPSRGNHHHFLPPPAPPPSPPSPVAPSTPPPPLTLHSDAWRRPAAGRRCCRSRGIVLSLCHPSPLPPHGQRRRWRCSGGGTGGGGPAGRPPSAPARPAGAGDGHWAGHAPGGGQGGHLGAPAGRPRGRGAHYRV